MTSSQPSTPTAVVLVLSAVIAGAAGYLVARTATPTQTAPPPAGSASLDAVAARLDDLAKRLDAIQRRPVDDATATSGVRRSVPAVDRAEIESIVRELLAEQAKPSEAPDAAVNVQAMVTEIADVGSQSERGQELWANARKAGKVDELVAAFERLAKENPNDPDAQADLGDAYIQKLLGSKDVMSQGTLSLQADKAYDAALAVDPTHWRARFSKAFSYTFWPDFLGKKAEAIDNFKILIDQQEQGAPKPGYDQTYLVLGNLYEQQGKGDEARKVWERGLALNPDSAALRQKLGH